MSRSTLFVCVFITQDGEVVTTETVLILSSSEESAREQILEEFPDLVHIVDVRTPTGEELQQREKGHPIVPNEKDKIAIKKFCTDNKVLVSYVVWYVEVGYLTTEGFKCFAENENHAIEQAFDAYPDIDYIISVKLASEEKCDG